MKMLISMFVLLFASSLMAQESEEFFHGSAVLTQVEYVFENGLWNMIKTPISGAITITRTDHDYGSQGWCPEHWSIQFKPTYDDLNTINEISTTASPNRSSEEWASAWVVNPEGKSLQVPGGNLYIISSNHAKVYMVMTPADPTVRAMLDPTTRKYSGTPIFMYGFQMRRVADYMQIDLRNRCTDPGGAGRGLNR
jgi:hypothetical protein